MIKSKLDKKKKELEALKKEKSEKNSQNSEQKFENLRKLNDLKIALAEKDREYGVLERVNAEMREKLKNYEGKSEISNKAVLDYKLRVEELN